MTSPIQIRLEWVVLAFLPLPDGRHRKVKIFFLKKSRRSFGALRESPTGPPEDAQIARPNTVRPSPNNVMLIKSASCELRERELVKLLPMR